MKVLFLPQTSELGPSSRYRVYQLLPWLQKQGIESEVSPGINSELYSQIYLQGRGSRRAALLASWKQRRIDVGRASQFDAVFIQKGVFPGLYPGFERKLAASKPLLFDFDDAIWLPRQGGNQLLRALHRESTVQEILRRAAAVIAGNECLADYARRFNRSVTVVPSCIDTARYPRAAGEPRIGWIGSRTTMPYLGSLRGVFETLGVTPRVIASGNPGALGFPVEFRQWRLETELDELAQVGIGIAPLPDNPWERGKCGVKLLQYMACGIPVVASPVGVHNSIIRHGINGFLAATDEQWIESLGQLVHDDSLRKRLGAAGRELVVQHYDVRFAAERVASVLRSMR